jgi:hypothetical protein
VGNNSSAPANDRALPERRDLSDTPMLVEGVLPELAALALPGHFSPPDPDDERRQGSRRYCSEVRVLSRLKSIPCRHKDLE